MKAAATSGDADQDYEQILFQVLADGQVDPDEREMLAEYAAERPACLEHHASILVRAGWTLEEYNFGLKEGDPRRSPSHDWDHLQWQATRTRRQSLLTDEGTEVDLEKALSHANEHFLIAYFDELRQSVDATCKEVIAAKVPLSSYGRVRDALENLRKSLNGRAKELLTQELDELRKVALGLASTEKAKLQVAQSAEAAGEAKVEELSQELKAATEAKVAAEAALKYISERSAAPLAAIQKAEDSIAATERKLSTAKTKISKLEEQARESHDEWESHLIECLRKCSIQMKGGQENALADPRKKDFGAAAIYFDNAIAKIGGGFGAKLAYLVGKYEEAKEAAVGKRVEERKLATQALAQRDEQIKAALEAKEEAVQKAQGRWQAEKNRLESALKEAVDTLDARTEEMGELKASRVPTAKFHQVEGELATAQTALASVQKELDDTTARLDAMTLAHDLSQKRLSNEQELRVVERGKRTESLRMLYAAQSASKWGGYYFSAAPTTSPTRRPSPPRSRSLSPNGDEQLEQEDRQFSRHYRSRFGPALMPLTASAEPSSPASRLRQASMSPPSATAVAAAASTSATAATSTSPSRSRRIRAGRPDAGRPAVSSTFGDGKASAAALSKAGRKITLGSPGQRQPISTPEPSDRKQFRSPAPSDRKLMRG